MLPGQNHPEQYHEKKKETFHVVHGSVDLVLDGDSIAKPGDVITIEPASTCSTSNDVSSRKSSTHFVNDCITIRRLPRTPSARHSSISGLLLGNAFFVALLSGEGVELTEWRQRCSIRRRAG